MKFSNDKIDIELKMKNVEYDLEIPMIEKFGEKGIENLKIQSEKVYSIKC